MMTSIALTYISAIAVVLVAVSYIFEHPEIFWNEEKMGVDF